MAFGHVADRAGRGKNNARDTSAFFRSLRGLINAAALRSAVGYPAGTLYGLTLSNNGANTIDIAAGSARDGADSANMDLLTALTAKDLSSTWAVGPSAGMLDTGVIANTTYYIYLIKRPDTGVVDVVASASASSPTMPTNFTLKRRLPGAIIRSGGSILTFKQFGKRKFLFKDRIRDINGASVGTSRSLLTTSVPPNMRGLFSAGVFNAASGVVLGLFATYETDAAPAQNSAPGASLISEVANAGVAGDFEIEVDASRQIAARVASGTGTTYLYTRGFIDYSA